MINTLYTARNLIIAKSFSSIFLDISIFFSNGISLATLSPLPQVTGIPIYGERCRYLHSWSIGDTFSLITPLKGHKKVISAIALPSGSDKLYSGSKDGTVKVWDCQTGQCVATVSMGREVGCMISVEPWLFFGIPDSIKVCNTQTGAEMSLSGPTGQVYALVAANDMLFAGTHNIGVEIQRTNKLFRAYRCSSGSQPRCHFTSRRRNGTLFRFHG